MLEYILLWVNILMCAFFFLYFSIMGKFIEQFVAFCSLDIVFFFGASYYVCVGILLLIIDIGDFLLISFLSLSSFLFVKISSFSPCISVKLLFVAFIWSCVSPSILFTYRMVLKIYNSFWGPIMSYRNLFNASGFYTLFCLIPTTTLWGGCCIFFLKGWNWFSEKSNNLLKIFQLACGVARAQIQVYRSQQFIFLATWPKETVRGNIQEGLELRWRVKKGCETLPSPYKSIVDSSIFYDSPFQPDC